MRSTHISDPEILRMVQESLPKKTHKPISPEVVALLEESNDSSNSASDSDTSDIVT